MGFESITCPGCGASVQLDDSQDMGYCIFCGRQVVREKIVVEHRVEHRVNESPKFKNLVTLGNNSFECQSWSEAREYYKEALIIDQSDPVLFVRIALCDMHIVAGLQNDCSSLLREINLYLNKAFSGVDDSKCKEWWETVFRATESYSASVAISFKSSDQFERYVYGIHNATQILEYVYKYSKWGSSGNIAKLVNKGMDLSSVLKPQYNLLTGSAMVNGKQTPVYSMTKVKASLYDNVQRIKKIFSGEANKQILPLIEEAQKSLNEVNESLASYGKSTETFYNLQSLPWAITALVMLCLYFPIGAVMLIFQGVCFAIYNSHDPERNIPYLKTQRKQLYFKISKLKEQLRR